MIRVCILTSGHPTFDIRIFQKEAKSLVKAGFEVTLIAQHDKEETVDGVKILHVQRPRNRFERMTKIVWSIFQKALAVNADIYHFHEPELFRVGMKLKERGKIVIFDSHEDYTEDILTKKWIPSYARKVVSRIYDRIEHCVVRRFDGVIAATPHIKKKFEKMNMNSIDINNYPITDSLAVNNSNTKAKGKHINYIGGIAYTRGINEMIRALEHTDACLVLAGKFFYSKEFNIVKSMKGWAKVDYRGQVDRSEVERILDDSAAGLVLFHPGPNHTDSQPNKLFEYMAAGLPVIASNFPLWKEIVEKNKCGICVNPLSPREIAAAINWVLQNPADAAEMGRNGRKAVLEKYNWETESKKLIKFYEEILQ